MPAEIEIDHHYDVGSRPRPSDALEHRRRWHNVADLAARQHGVVARRQLASLGLGRGAIERALSNRRLTPVHHGVYAVGHARLTPTGRTMAAVLAGGPSAVLSHRGAAMLWGILPRAPRAVDITLPARRAARPGIVPHHARLAPDERTTLDSIPVTTVARTLLDLAGVLAPHRLTRALHEAEYRRLADPVGVAALLARHPGRRGATALRAAIADAQLGVDVTREALEARFAAFVLETGLPRPIANARVEGLEVDAAWPAQRLIVELDGHASHATRRGFERDRARDRRLVAAGWRVVRITWRQLHAEPVALAADLGRLLGPRVTT